MPELALIGGTGISGLPGFETLKTVAVETRFGVPSGPVIEGRYAGTELLFLPRHGRPHTVPPHCVNYRANMVALAEQGVTTVIATNAVGGLHKDWHPGHLAIPHQIIDYTWGREHSLYDGTEDGLDHVDFTEPYTGHLRELLIVAAADSGFAYSDRAVYAATQGPRLESAAEITRLQRDGCDVVGMTGMPEAALARELGLDYAAVCTVVNPAAGIGEEPLTLESMHTVIQESAGRIAQLLDKVIPRLSVTLVA